MPPKRKLKCIAGQQSIAAAFSASTSSLLPDSDQRTESASALPASTAGSSSTEVDEPTAKRRASTLCIFLPKKQTFLKQWLTCAHHAYMCVRNKNTKTKHFKTIKTKLKQQTDSGN